MKEGRKERKKERKKRDRVRPKRHFVHYIIPSKTYIYIYRFK